MSQYPVGEPIVLPNGETAPFSPAYRAGDLLFISGQIAFEEDGTLSTGDVAHQTRLCLAAIDRILAAEGLDKSAIVKCGIWLTDKDDFAAFNEVYADYLGDHRPARFTVRSDLVVPHACVEIEATAVYK